MSSFQDVKVKKPEDVDKSCLKHIKIPDLKKYIKVTPKFNEHFNEVIDGAKDWIKNLIIKSNLNNYENFYRLVDHEVFCGFIFSHASAEGLRIAMDMNNYFFLFDDILEKGIENSEKCMNVLVNVTKNLNHMEGESEFEKGLRDVLLRLKTVSTPENFQTFWNSTLVYAKSAMKQPKRKKLNQILNFEDYMAERYEAVGVKFVFDCALITNNIELFEKFEKNEVYEKLERAAGECLFITNDIYSFFVEYVKNRHDMNIITIFMKNDDLTMQEAFDKAGTLFAERLQKFHEHKEEVLRLFTCEKVHDNLKRHVDCIENMIYGNLEWSIKTGRYKHMD